MSTANTTTPIVAPELTDDVLRCLLFTPGSRYGHWGLPFCLSGPPGISKSSRIRDIAEQAGLPVVTRFASIHDPTDFAGMPVVASDFVRQLPLQWAAALAEKQNVVLLMDEITTAALATQNALLGVILERQIGDLPLPKGVRVVAAGNPADIAVAGRDLGPAQANRMLHFSQGVDVNAWCSYYDDADDYDVAHERLSEATTAALDLQAHVRSQWDAHYREARALCTTFMRAASGDSALNSLFNFPAEDDPAYSGAWPSPRSWEMFGRGLAGARIHGLGLNGQLAIARACLGQGVAQHLAQYLAYGDLPSPVDLLSGAVSFKHSDNSPARTVIMFGACARELFAMAKAQDERAPQWMDRYWTIVLSVLSTRPDLAAHGTRPFMVIDEHTKFLKALKGVGRQVCLDLKNSGILQASAA